jgi:hypothetical protein
VSVYHFIGDRPGAAMDDEYRELSQNVWPSVLLGRVYQRGQNEIRQGPSKTGRRI